MVVFRAGEARCGLPVAAVAEILPAAAVTALPGAPPVVLGALDVRGEVLPVVSLRRKLGLAERALDPDDRFLVASAPRLVLHADAVEGVVPAAAGVAVWRPGVARDGDGLLLIQDLADFLGDGEAEQVRELIAQLPR
jgi:purine-binding chemotaxis protein CheW